MWLNSAMTKVEAFARLCDVLPRLHGKVVEGVATPSALTRSAVQGRRFPDGVDRAAGLNFGG